MVIICNDHPLYSVAHGRCECIRSRRTVDLSTRKGESSWTLQGALIWTSKLKDLAGTWIHRTFSLDVHVCIYIRVHVYTFEYIYLYT